MAQAHILGLPLEEALPALGGPAALYLAAVAVGLRATRRRIAALARRWPSRG